ncbi:MAG: ATP-binding protein, partial [Ramlibacter sp.]
TRGRVTLERKPLDARQVVAMAVEQVRPMLQFRRHALDVRLPEEPAMVFGDGKRLVQVLTNLLTNAAKYTSASGHITLELQRDGDQVCLAVTDDGVGMSPELVANCFDLFVQAERTSDRAQGGLGIGLALVKSLVELHGGSVRAHSDGPGKGSRFTVTLPLDAAATRDEAQERPRAPEPAEERRKVLVVDDNADAAETLALLLQALGHDALVEHDPRAALERIDAEHPEIALVDVGLPGMDGYELARSVRERAGGKSMTLIAVTGYGQPQDREKALRAGFDEHLVKPADVGRLQQLLATSRTTAHR